MFHFPYAALYLIRAIILYEIRRQKSTINRFKIRIRMQIYYSQNFKCSLNGTELIFSQIYKRFIWENCAWKCTCNIFICILYIYNCHCHNSWIFNFLTEGLNKIFHLNSLQYGVFVWTVCCKIQNNSKFYNEWETKQMLILF